MKGYIEILDVYAREILDSRGNPKVEVDVLVQFFPFINGSKHLWISIVTEENPIGTAGHL